MKRKKALVRRKKSLADVLEFSKRLIDEDACVDENVEVAFSRFETNQANSSLVISKGQGQVMIKEEEKTLVLEQKRQALIQNIFEANRRANR